MIFAGIEIVKWIQSYINVEQDLSEAQQQEFADFQVAYPDTVGWLSLEGTRIDNPVMQTTNNEFYLTHNYKGEKSRGGSIFLDYRTDADLTQQHTIFYGHVLRNETMFGSLDKFADEQYAKEHAVFQYVNGNEQFELQVFAAYETTTDFYYIETNFEDGEFANFLELIREKSAIEMDSDVTEEDRIVTFSTCTTSMDDKERFVVHAKVVKK